MALIGNYKGYGYKLQRICDVMHNPSHAQYYFLYVRGEPTGDHFKRLTELRRYIDALPPVTD